MMSSALISNVEDNFLRIAKEVLGLEGYVIRYFRIVDTTKREYGELRLPEVYDASYRLVTQKYSFSQSFNNIICESTLYEKLMAIKNLGLVRLNNKEKPYSISFPRSDTQPPKKVNEVVLENVPEKINMKNIVNIEEHVSNVVIKDFIRQIGLGKGKSVLLQFQGEWHKCTPYLMPLDGFTKALEDFVITYEKENNSFFCLDKPSDKSFTTKEKLFSYIKKQVL